MYAKLLCFSLLTAVSAYSSPIDCASDPRGPIEVTVENGHEKGELKVDGISLKLSCQKSSTGPQLSCKAFRANSVYHVELNRVTTRTRIWNYKGKVERVIGGFAGNIKQDLGGLLCAEWSDGSLPR
jgi:hypothetical protein